jgi:cytochrome c
MKQLLLLICAGLLLNDAPVFAETTAVDGKTVFDRNCSVCHAINPPPKSAPPIAPLSSRYHQKFTTRKDGVSYMQAYIKSPDKNRAVEKQAIVRFGLMPPVPLSDKELNAVAGWVWDQYNQNFGGCQETGGQGSGMGRMNR